MSAAPPSDRLTLEDGLVFNGIPRSPARIRGFLTTRSGGSSPAPWATLNAGTSQGDDAARVQSHLERIGVFAGHPPGGWARVRMEHGPRVRVVEAPGVAGWGDGLATRTPDLPLAVTVADCVPLFLWCDEAVALLHCGWRGIARGIVENGVGTVAALAGAGPSRIAGWIGPGIGRCCYEVGWDVAARIAPVPPAPDPSAKVPADLGRTVLDRLEALGLARDRIARSVHCTSCRPDLYFSHRRDGAPTGRMLALIVRDATPPPHPRRSR